MILAGTDVLAVPAALFIEHSEDSHKTIPATQEMKLEFTQHAFEGSG
jgi:hypothetical protein